MTPKEKAEQLVNRFDMIIYTDQDHVSQVKRCAILAVDEILNLDLHDVGDYRNDQASSDDFSTVTWYINYWEEVKEEIEKIEQI